MKIETKYGVCVRNKRGYYRIISQSEGNFNKFLHRCVVEEYYGKIPQGHNIHHINGDKSDNRLENLVVLPVEQHNQLHKMLEKNGVNKIEYKKT